MRTSAVADTVVVELEARTAQYDAAMARSAANFDRAATSMFDSSGRIASAARVAAIGIGGLALATTAAVVTIAPAFIRTAEAANRAENSLRAVGLRGAELNAVWNQLYAVAQKNFVPMEDLVRLYGRVSIAQKDLRASSDQIVQMTDAVAASLRIMGRSPTEARGALLQLSQALGEGTVRAQEFNSLLENALPLLQAAANGIEGVGGSVAKLRKLVVEGKLSSEAFFRAILIGQKELEERAANIEPTVAQAWTAFSNGLMNFVRSADDALGVTKGLAGVLADFTRFTEAATTGLFGLNIAMTEQVRLANMQAREWVYARAALAKYGAELNRVGAFSPIVPGEKTTGAAGAGGWTTTTKINPEGFPTLGKTKKGGISDAQREADWWERQAEQYEKAALAQERANRKLEEEIKLVGLTEQARDKALIVLKLTEEAKRRGVELDDEERAKIEWLAETHARLNEQLRRERDLRSDIRDLQQQFGNLAISSIEGLADGSKKLNDVLQDTLKLLVRMALQAAILGQGPLAGFLGLKGPAMASGGNAIGGLFGGFFASGGSTPGNKPIITGENGPEMWVPGKAGSIIKNSDLVGGRSEAGITVAMQNDFRDSSAPAITVLSQRIDRLERNLPNIIQSVQTYGRSTNPFYGG